MQSTPLYIPAPYQDSAEFGRLILRDGSTATVRVATVEDAPAVAEFFHRLSPESLQHRFFSFAEPPPDFVRSLCDSSNPRVQLTLVITRRSGDRETIVAAGSYIGREGKTAEVAMAVEDKLQGKGIGTHLLERLALLAARAGFTRFWAVTQLDNRGMIDVFRHSGFPIAEKFEGGYLDLDFSVVPTESSVELSEMRDRVFTAASLRWFFKPASVAVVGASREPSSIGYRILQALVMNCFQGPVYPSFVDILKRSRATKPPRHWRRVGSTVVRIFGWRGNWPRGASLIACGSCSVNLRMAISRRHRRSTWRRRR